MRDRDCTALLRWCLPRLALQWQGYRKVRGTVCKRIDRRRRELGLRDTSAYQAHLEAHEGEWKYLDRLCRIPISRFWRDPEVFSCLAADVLPRLAALARDRPRRTVRCWSAGCASGEEPYGLRLAWAAQAEADFSEVGIEIVATDADETLLARAGEGVYRSSSLRDLPVALRDRALERSGHDHRIRAELRQGVRFFRQDVRTGAPRGRFDLILCRNLAFTYFEPTLQREVLARLAGKLQQTGYLVIGAKERLPDDRHALVQASEHLPIYRSAAPPPSG